jgi:hypothetical protein
MMSRFSNHLDTLRSIAHKRPRLSTPSVMSRVTIWIDGKCARVLGSPQACVTLADSGDTAAALKAIETLAPKPANLGLHALRVVVGAPFVRYYALPWQTLPRPQDWIPGARVQALQTGAGAEVWRYAVTDGTWGHGRLAAAMPEALCAGIAQLCKKRKVQLSGIEPGYTFALQKHAARIRDGAIAIVEVENADGGSAIAHIGLRRGGGWTGFIALPLNGPLDDVLRDAFALCADTPPERRYVIGAKEALRASANAAPTEWLAAPWDAAS